VGKLAQSLSIKLNGGAFLFSIFCCVVKLFALYLTYQTKQKQSIMTQVELNSRINDLKEGDFLDLTLTKTFGTAGVTIQRLTSKAILVNDQWIPKSQIVDISYGHFYKGVESNTKSTEHKQIALNGWWDDKTASENWAKRGAPCAY